MTAALPQVPRASRVRDIWDARATLRVLVSRDLKVKYADSVLGYVWSILDPLLMALVYWFVFTKIFHRNVGDEPYILFLLTALLPWNWANGVITDSSRALTADAKLVRSTRLPREIWVLRTVSSKFAEFLLSLPVIALFALAYGKAPTWDILLVPLAMVIQAVFLIGCALLLAPVTVMFSDVQRLVRIVMRVMFYLTPVIYGLVDVKRRHPGIIHDILILNPLAGIFSLYRAAFFPDQWTGWYVVAVSVIGSVLVLLLGASVFSRLEGTVLKEI